MTLAELAESTGHAPGEPLVEIEPEVEQHYTPPIRVTPMSPASEIAAFGQLTNARPERKGLARGAALFLLAPIALALLFEVARALS
jgi:hypothetical protein